MGFDPVMKTREVVVTKPFWLVFESQVAHFERVQTLHPDAGLRLARLADDLTERIIPLLARSPDIGRLYALAALPASSRADKALSVRLSAVLAGLVVSKAVLREYVDAQFNILYAVTPTKAYLINLRHQKQSGY